jgi:hypothetical protein
MAVSLKYRTDPVTHVIFVASSVGPQASFTLLPPETGSGPTTSTAQQQQHLRHRVALIQESLTGSNTRSLTETKAASSAPAVHIKLEHLRAAFEGMGPSVSAVERVRYERIYSDFIQSRGGDFATSMYNQEKKQTLA